jgi:hypothetical protein
MMISSRRFAMVTPFALKVMSPYAIFKTTSRPRKPDQNGMKAGCADPS